MKIQYLDDITILTPNENCLLYSKLSNEFYKKIYLGIHGDSNNYIDICLNEVGLYNPIEEIEDVKSEQITQKQLVATNMMNTTSLYEIIMGAVMINTKNGIATPHEILQTYETLLSKNIKTLNEIPDYVRSQLNLK